MDDRIQIKRIIDYFRGTATNTFKSFCSIEAYLHYRIEYEDFTLVLRLDVIDSKGYLNRYNQQLSLKNILMSSIPNEYLEHTIDKMVTKVKEEIGDAND